MKNTFKLAIIGGGNMATALLSGILNSKTFDPEDIIITDILSDRLDYLKNTYRVETTTDNAYAIASAPMILLAVKPNVIEKAVKKDRNILAGKAVVYIVAGWKSDALRALLPENTRVLRVMPNTPALVGEGMSVLCSDNDLTDEEYEIAKNVFSAVGSVIELEEKYIDAVTGLSGSGPAYVYMFIEALADGGVRMGLPRATAYKLAAQMVFGSAKMVIETGKHPGELKDMVCSPAGTTIEGVKTLEEKAFRNAVIEAVTAGTLKSIELGK